MLFEPCGLRFPLQSFAGRVVVSTGLNRVGRFRTRIADSAGATNKHKGPRYAPTLLRLSWCVYASLLTGRFIGGFGLAGKGARARHPAGRQSTPNAFLHARTVSRFARRIFGVCLRHLGDIFAQQPDPVWPKALVGRLGSFHAPHHELSKLLPQTTPRQ